MDHPKQKHIRLFSGFLRERYGIHFPDHKTDMLQVKLHKLMNRVRVDSYEDYFRMISSGQDPAKLHQFLDEVATHTTRFFREAGHFDYLRTEMESILRNNRRILDKREIRVWSAASSTGQEPYTLAMVLAEVLPSDVGIKILGTDISKKVLQEASAGHYPASVRAEIPPALFQRYFQKEGNGYTVTPDLRSMVTFRLLNLLDPFPFKQGFDLVFCRNVMIYFEPEVQEQLVRRFYNVIQPGGLLFIGQSESIMYKNKLFRYMGPSVYGKP